MEVIVSLTHTHTHTSSEHTHRVAHMTAFLPSAIHTHSHKDAKIKMASHTLLNLYKNKFLSLLQFPPISILIEDAPATTTTK